MIKIAAGSQDGEVEGFQCFYPWPPQHPPQHPNSVAHVSPVPLHPLHCLCPHHSASGSAALLSTFFIKPLLVQKNINKLARDWLTLRWTPVEVSVFCAATWLLLDSTYSLLTSLFGFPYLALFC